MSFGFFQTFLRLIYRFRHYEPKAKQPRGPEAEVPGDRAVAPGCFAALANDDERDAKRPLGGSTYGLYCAAVVSAFCPDRSSAGD